MPQCLEPRWSDVPTLSKCQALEDLLKYAGRAEMISFAGGLPTPESFPIQELSEASTRIMRDMGARALQYSAANGELALRQAIADLETQWGVPTTADEVLILTGSQQALDLIARSLINPGDKILVENPTYLGAIQAFKIAKPTFAFLPEDEQGVNPEWIEAKDADAKFVYTMPTFANPTGRTMNLERRIAFAKKARELDLWIMEDDPYGQLWYDAPPPKPLRALAPERTIKLGTLSKILSPGMRLGYLCGPKHVIDMFARVKPALDLHTCSWTQLVAAEVINNGLLETHLPRVRNLYKTQATCMMQALEECLPKHPGISWERVAGGMFIWLGCPEQVNTTTMLDDCVKQSVAYIPGQACYATGNDTRHMRLSFATVPPDKIRHGIAILGNEILKHL